MKHQDFKIGDIYYECGVSSTAKFPKGILVVSSWLYEGVAGGGKSLLSNAPMSHRFSEVESLLESKQPGEKLRTTKSYASLEKASEALLTVEELMVSLTFFASGLESAEGGAIAACSACRRACPPSALLLYNEEIHVICPACSRRALGI